jgi:hypothetical protein
LAELEALELGFFFSTVPFGCSRAFFEDLWVGWVAGISNYQKDIPVVLSKSTFENYTRPAKLDPPVPSPDLKDTLSNSERVY